MNKFILLAETGSDLPTDIAKEYGIEVVPMHVMFNNHNYDDGAFDVNEIIKFYNETKTIPTTSATNVGEYLEAYEKIHKEYPEATIIHLCYSAVTTATYQNSIIANEGLDYIEHIDTKAVSAGQGFIVYKTAKFINDNKDITIDEIKEYVNRLIEDTHMVFIPSQLDFLKAGGRVSNAAYLGANILGLKPSIEIIDGKLVATKKYRGRDLRKITKRLFSEYIERYNCDKEDIFLIKTVDLDKNIIDDIDAAAKEQGFKNIRWVQANGVITTHCGPGGFGIVVLENKS